MLSFIFLEILEKIAEMTKISPQKMNHGLLENALTDFSLKLIDVRIIILFDVPASFRLNIHFFY